MPLESTQKKVAMFCQTVLYLIYLFYRDPIYSKAYNYLDTSLFGPPSDKGRHDGACLLLCKNGTTERAYYFVRTARRSVPSVPTTL